MDAAMSAQSDLAELGRQFLYPNYRQAPLVLVRGQGAVLWDAEGKRYLDMPPASRCARSDTRTRSSSPRSPSRRRA